MSQKTTRRGRRQTTEEEPTPFKAPTPIPTEPENVTEEPPSQQPSEEVQQPPQEESKVIEQNGTEKDESDSCIMTRSRSATPQVKQVVTQNGREEEKEPEAEAEDKETGKEEELNTSVKDNNTDSEMDPLIVSDEPDPELMFEENSDKESGKSSPILSRCKTRRSPSRSVPTPKTPKLAEESENAVSPKDNEDLNASFESCSDDISTKAEAGGDSTRLYYMDKDFSNLESNSFLQGTKDKSFGEAMRCLSTRRTIRPTSEDYRKRILKTNLNKSEFDGSSYPVRYSVERVSVGVKRKNCEEDGGFGKRFKGESPGFFARLTSPLASIRNTFRSDIPSSTPKLTGYKDEKFLLEDEGVNSQMCEVNDGERRWCSIM